MKSLGGAATALGDGGGSEDADTPSPMTSGSVKFSECNNDDWQNFETVGALQPAEVYQFSLLAGRVIKYCFEAGSEDSPAKCTTINRREVCNQHGLRLYLRNVRTVTCPTIQSTLNTVVTSQVEFPRLEMRLALPAECSDFDWDSDCDGVKVDSISPMVFRPGQPESPVGVDFDHERASLGLSALSNFELNAMCQEMERKFKRLSDSLIIDLQLRDKLVIELTVKNKFISAMLRVQSLKQSCCGVVSGVGGMDGRARSKSLRTKPSGERKYLSSIIPYCPPEDNNWNVSTLLAIIEILNSIAEDSDNVSTLVAEYLQNEVLR